MEREAQRQMAVIEPRAGELDSDCDAQSIAHVRQAESSGPAFRESHFSSRELNFGALPAVEIRRERQRTVQCV
jgi:hypothetical protein